MEIKGDINAGPISRWIQDASNLFLTDAKAMHMANSVLRAVLIPYVRELRQSAPVKTGKLRDKGFGIFPFKTKAGAYGGVKWNGRGRMVNIIGHPSKEDRKTLGPTAKLGYARWIDSNRGRIKPNRFAQNATAKWVPVIEKTGRKKLERMIYTRLRYLARQRGVELEMK